MLVLGLVLSIFAVGFVCWLLFTLAIYALPLFVAITAGLAAYHHDSGLIGALLAGLLAGAATLAIGRMAFALSPSALLRALIALLFAAPAAVAGYEATLGLLQLGVASHLWCAAFAGLGAIVTGGTAFARMVIPNPFATGGFARTSVTVPAAGS